MAGAIWLSPIAAQEVPAPTGNSSVELQPCLQFARLSAQDASPRVSQARSLHYQNVNQDLIRTVDPLEQIWLRCKIGSPQESGDFILVFSDLRIDLIDVYLGDSTEPAFQGGDARPDFQSNFLRPNATIRLEKGASASLWIRLSGAYNVPTDISVYGPMAFQKQARMQTFWQSMFFGILLVMIVFYGIGLFAFKDAAVRGYLMYLSGVTLYFL
ncbi:MAG: hypothetical protein KDK37_15105, partial [Leptospiraceae bacterium]|nr:hypothetical protein [Leptospiraceae bacterium]